MKAQSADVIIVGGGVMGCAAAYHLAKDGKRVLLIEQFTIGHNKGSSNGASRLFRLIHDGMDYVQLARAAERAWRDLEADSDQRLLQRVDGLDIGTAKTLAGFRVTMESAGVWFEALDRAEIMHRFPQFALPENTLGFYQTDYGLIAADRTLSTLASKLLLHGATIAESESVQQLRASGDGVEVRTEKGKYHGERLVLAAGPWIGPLTRQLGLALPLTVTKELSTYYKPTDMEAFMPGRFPIFRHHLTGGTARWGVGFPIFEHVGVKMVMDCAGPVVDPDDPDRTPVAVQQDEAREYAAGILPTLGGDIIETETCLYTMTPDEHFIIDRHPDFPQIVIASPCSGAGFKFAPLIGRILADLATSGTTQYNIERFRLDRAGLKNGKV